MLQLHARRERIPVAYGIRALSRYHSRSSISLWASTARPPRRLRARRIDTGLFGGNSNWRGPIWFPVNYLLIESLQKFHHYYGDDFKVECPTGSGTMLTLGGRRRAVAPAHADLPARRPGRRPVSAARELPERPALARPRPFYEYFHGDNGAASAPAIRPAGRPGRQAAAAERRIGPLEPCVSFVAKAEGARHLALQSGVKIHAALSRRRNTFECRSRFRWSAESPLTLSGRCPSFSPVLAGANLKQEPLLVPERSALGAPSPKSWRAKSGRRKKSKFSRSTSRGVLPFLEVVPLRDRAARPEMTNADWRTYAAKAAQAANAAKATSLVVGVPDGFPPEQLRFLSEGLVLGEYRFNKYMTGERRPKAELAAAAIAIGTKARIGKVHKASIEVGEGVARAVALTRDLVNEPPNELYPAVWRLRGPCARKPGSSARSSMVKAIQQSRDEAVHRGGSRQRNEPRFIHLIYKPKKPKKKLVFIGKGLTFDSGGLCIKPAAGMGEMKGDMARRGEHRRPHGCRRRSSPTSRCTASSASAENMPDGTAYRPGDIFGSLDGKTVEIINTDAEGRLVLADALAYARELKPDVLVDNATLTGACVVALGNTCSGFYATDDELADALQRRAEAPARRCGACRSSRTSASSSRATGPTSSTPAIAGAARSPRRSFSANSWATSPWIHGDIAGPSMASKALQGLRQGRPVTACSPSSN